MSKSSFLKTNLLFEKHIDLNRANTDSVINVVTLLQEKDEALQSLDFLDTITQEADFSREYNESQLSPKFLSSPCSSESFKIVLIECK